MKKYVLVGAVALLVLALLAVPAYAAVEKVTAYGTVVDERGQPVSGVTVNLINDETYGASWHVLATTTSDANGNFKFNNVETQSPYLMVLLNYTVGGKTYKTTVNDQQWSDASQGLIAFSRNFTKLTGYPESDHGYAWGLIMDAAVNGRALSGTVYLANDTTTLIAESASNGAYEIVATPGDYVIYAAHKAADGWLVSDRINITITSAYNRNNADPLTLVADRMTTVPPPTPTPAPPVIAPASPHPTEIYLPSPTATPAASAAQPVKALPLAAALALGAILIIVAWAILGRKQQ